MARSSRGARWTSRSTRRQAGGPAGVAGAAERGSKRGEAGGSTTTNLDARRAGTCTIFVDSASGENILEVGSDANGVVLLAFRLYDSRGRLTAESDGFEQFPDGITVKCKGGEQLLHVPRVATAPVKYRLYNSTGRLLTWSDGSRTKIYPQLRMDGVTHGWAPPGAAPSATNGRSAR